MPAIQKIAQTMQNIVSGKWVNGAWAGPHIQCTTSPLLPTIGAHNMGVVPPMAQICMLNGINRGNLTLAKLAVVLRWAMGSTWGRPPIRFTNSPSGATIVGCIAGVAPALAWIYAPIIPRPGRPSSMPAIQNTTQAMQNIVLGTLVNGVWVGPPHSMHKVAPSSHNCGLHCGHCVSNGVGLRA